MRPKLVALIVAASLTGGWLLGSVVAPPVAELQGLPARMSPRSSASEPATDDAAFTEQLHLKLQSAPVAPVPRRNPFVFGTTPRSSPDAREIMHATQPAPAPEISPTPVGPRLVLSGIASTNTSSGVVLTAVILDDSGVHLAKIGDVVSGYRVVAITEDSATIADAADAQWKLTLR